MSYNPHTWATGDAITASQLNTLELGVAAAVTGIGITQVQRLTQAAYTALGSSVDPNTLYVIQG